MNTIDISHNLGQGVSHNGYCMCSLASTVQPRRYSAEAFLVNIFTPTHYIYT